MKKPLSILKYGLIALVSMAWINTAHADIISGSGSSFQAQLQQIWSYFYNLQDFNKINYQSAGSSTGIKQTLSGISDFGGTDAPLDTPTLVKNNLFQIPMVSGGIIPITNIQGVHSSVVLSGDILAQIYMGKILMWDDPKITAINPKIKLPHKKIVTVHRSDGSGTTFNFTAYLAYASPQWKKEYGVHKSLTWFNGIGGIGNPGIASSVSSNTNSIGYVEFDYANKGKELNQFFDVKIKTKNNQIVTSSNQTIINTINAYKWETSTQGWFFNATNLTIPENDKSWPICAVSFVVVNKHNQYVGEIGRYIKSGLNPTGAKYALKVGLTPISAHLASAISTFIDKNFK